MSGTSISSLVVRAQTGDRATYDRIVHRFKDMAVGYARSLFRPIRTHEIAVFLDLPVATISNRLRSPANIGKRR
ncbi:hypothetical protein OAF45_00805 [Candidatus Latescibacteria bacterium]|nr:hypothetical protein [Candidatus Latescibacterota bacterium]